jgi:hypothetical protein
MTLRLNVPHTVLHLLCDNAMCVLTNVYLCVCETSAGWEHIYDFLDHFLGSSGKYGGVGMHLGHYKRHTDFMISLQQVQSTKGFFNSKYWVRFITAGVALWMQSLDPGTHSPCCDLEHIGGDGTGIGISMNEVLSLEPIWQPRNLLSTQPISWGRLDRCVIPSPSNLKTTERQMIAAAKKFCNELLANDSKHRERYRGDLKDHKHAIPDDVYAETHRWLGNLDVDSFEWLALKRLLKASYSDECVLGIINSTIANTVAELLALLNPKKRPANESEKSKVWRMLHEIRQHGMGDDIAVVMKSQIKDSQHFKPQATTWRFVKHLREYSLVFLFSFAFLFPFFIFFYFFFLNHVN